MKRCVNDSIRINFDGKLIQKVQDDAAGTSMKVLFLNNLRSTVITIKCHQNLPNDFDSWLISSWDLFFRTVTIVFIQLMKRANREFSHLLFLNGQCPSVILLKQHKHQLMHFTYVRIEKLEKRLFEYLKKYFPIREAGWFGEWSRPIKKLNLGC